MKNRRAVSVLFAAIVFVGVMLVMVSADGHVLRHGVPVSLFAAAGAAVASWRWSEHQS